MGYINLFEGLTLNGVSVAWIIANAINHGWGVNNAQDLIMILVGLSIVFFNAMRGIKAYSHRRRSSDDKSMNDK